MSQTLLIIKPDAVERGLVGHVIDRMERAGFKIREMRMLTLTEEKARSFYAVHDGKPFLDNLVTYMTSSPVVSILLAKDNAVEDLRTLIGATDPAQATSGTIRHEIAVDTLKNSVHASDSDESAAQEIAHFF